MNGYEARVAQLVEEMHDQARAIVDSFERPADAARATGLSTTSIHRIRYQRRALTLETLARLVAAKGGKVQIKVRR